MSRAPSDLRWRRSRHDLDRLIDVVFGLLHDDRFEVGVYHAHGCQFIAGGNVDTSDIDRAILSNHARLVHSVAELMAVRAKLECELLEHCWEYFVSMHTDKRLHRLICSISMAHF